MSGGTDWTKYQVPTLASITNEDLGSTWQQVGAWISTADMIATTRQNLIGARKDLAAAWPPETSQAAAIFYDVLDTIADAMTDTENATRTNAAALQQALSSMTSTKEAVRQLHNTWQLYQRQMRDATVTSQAQIDEGLPYNWTAPLNAEARGHMVATDQVVFDTTRGLVVPPELPQIAILEPLTPIPGGGVDGTTGRTSKHRSVASPQAGTPFPQGGRGAGTQPGLPAAPVLTGQGPVTGGGSPASGGGGTSVTGPGSGPTGPGWPGGRPVGPNPTPPPGAPGTLYPPVAGVPILGDGTPGSIGAPGASSSVSYLRGASGAADSPIPGSVEEFGRTGTGTPPTAGMTEPFEAAPQTGGMMIPSMMGGLTTGAPNGRKRSHVFETIWNLPAGVPSVIMPAVESDIHDPGRGVIGIDL